MLKHKTLIKLSIYR